MHQCICLTPQAITAASVVKIAISGPAKISSLRQGAGGQGLHDIPQIHHRGAIAELFDQCQIVADKGDGDAAPLLDAALAKSGNWPPSCTKTNRSEEHTSELQSRT